MATPTSIPLDDDLRGRVHHLAEKRGQTPEWLFHEAIAQYVEREERRDAFAHATRQAWEEYRRSGLHLTADDVDAWLARLEAGEDAEIPACHT